MGLRKWIRDRVTTIDLYPATVSLTYRGNKTYKSFCGGLLSMIATLFVAGYAIYVSRKMLAKTEITANIYTSYKNRARTSEAFDFEPGNLPFAFELSDTGSQTYFINKKHYLLQLVRLENFYSGSQPVIRIAEEYKIEE